MYRWHLKSNSLTAKNGIRTHAHATTRSFINMMDTCQENLRARRHTHRDVPCRTPKAQKRAVTHLVDAFLLVHHPSAHRSERAALPFSTLQWSQTQETPLIYCSSVQESEGGREGGVEQERREWEETEVEEGKRRREKGGRELLIVSTAPPIPSSPPSSSLNYPRLSLYLFFLI